MRILVHDFAGYAFPLKLSRQLALQGHSVLHVYSEGLPGPKGSVERQLLDSPRFRVQPITLPGYFRKYSPVRRFIAQRRYSADLRRLISAEKPDVVLSGDTPIDIQAGLLRHCHRNGVSLVHWVQDVYCEALRFLLKRRWGGLADTVVAPFAWLEKSVAQKSDSVVVIAPAFLSKLVGLKVPASKITVIENWASLEEIHPLPYHNAWRESMTLDERPVFLYSGTLGLKHRPDLLYKLAQSLGPRGQVVVVSESVGRDYLQGMPKLENLKLLDFQPYSRLSEVLASADVLLATLEAEAGEFAVPSKVLTYLCAGRPVLLAAPPNNLAADVIRRSGAGMAIDPAEEQCWLDAAQQLASNSNQRVELGANARRYAEKNFDIQTIAANFERILAEAIHQPRTAEIAASAILEN